MSYKIGALKKSQNSQKIHAVEYSGSTPSINNASCLKERYMIIFLSDDLGISLDCLIRT